MPKGPFQSFDEEALGYRDVWESQFPQLFEASSKTSTPGCMSSSEEASSGFRFNTLPDGSKLVRILCISGAYNFGYTYFHATKEEQGYSWDQITFPQCQQSQSGATRGVILNPSFEEENGTLTAFIKGRGLGDCGTSFEFYWQTSADSFCMHQCSHKEECDGRMNNWPETQFNEGCAPDPAFEQLSAKSDQEPTKDSEQKSESEHAEKPRGHAFKDPHVYAKRWSSEKRMEWQKPELLMQIMGIEPGMTVADIGTGTGFLLPYIDQKLAGHGRIAAVDIEEAMLTYVAHQVEPDISVPTDLCLSTPDSSPLAPHAIDRIITINTWHHVPHRVAYAKMLKDALRPSGKFFIVDYHKDSPSGPPADMRLTPETVIEELEQAGFHAKVLPAELPRQYLIEATLSPLSALSKDPE